MAGYTALAKEIMRHQKKIRENRVGDKMREDELVRNKVMGNNAATNEMAIEKTWWETK